MVQKRIQHIAKQIGNRVVATDEEHEAARYMSNQMEKAGLSVQMEEFPALGWRVEAAHLQVNTGGKWRQSACHPLSHSPNTPKDGITAPLVNLGTASEAEMADVDCEDRIGFVFGLLGDEPSKLRRLCDSGLAAVLFVDECLPMPWVVHAGMPAGWIDLLTVPAATVAYTEAWEIAQMSDPTARLIVRGERFEGKSHNVVGSFQAQNPDLPPLVLTCHHDSVTLGEGAEDNGSGMSVLLAVAEALGKGKPPRPIKLISCGWEENLSEGSRQYVAADLQRAENTGLVINIDSVGAWMGHDWVYVVGSDGLVEWTRERISEVPFCADVARKVSPFSDMFAFNLVGVPSLWFHRSNCGDSRFYHHSAEDSLDKLSFDQLAHTAEAVTNCVWQLGASSELPFDGTIPSGQADELAAYRRDLFDSICDWKTTGLMKPDSES